MGFGRYALRAALGLGLMAAVSISSAAAVSAGSLPDRAYPNVVYARSASGSPLAADIYSPAAPAKAVPVVIMVHGGGFNAGDKAGLAPYASAMAALGFVVVNVNYTLSTAGRAGYPVQVQEIRDAITWTIAHARQYGGDPTRLALVGFSAGGYLAAMAGLQDSGVPGRPVKAIVTLSAPLDLPAIDQMFRARIALCGYRATCPQQPDSRAPSSFGTLFDFLGCPKGNCSPQLIQDASPRSHVSTGDPSFLIFNSADELIPASQATDMASALQADRVPAKVVIVPGTQHGEAYLPDVSGSILQYLGGELGTTPTGHLAYGAPSAASGPSALLVACCLAVAAGSVGIIALTIRRRVAGRP
jgi:acetyl esterase/lipase